VSVEIDERTAQLLAERHFANEPAYDWAVKCLEAGFDSSSLRMLASMTAADSPSEIDNMVGRVFRENGWNEIDPYLYLMRYARTVAEGILSSKTDPIQGSHEIYRILRATDGHSELSAWWDIDEMISARDHFAKTGTTDYYYRGDAQLFAEIKNACADFLVRSRSSVGVLPETSFDEAEALFRRFLSENGHPPKLKWVFAEDVLLDGRSVIIRVPLPDENHARARECYELGIARNLGINIHGLCLSDGEICCYVQLPEDDVDAQYKLLDPKFVRFSVVIDPNEAIPCRSGIIWKFWKIKFSNKDTGYEGLIPSRKTLLPLTYKTQV